MTTELHTLSGAYALDALSAEEAAAFRTHLDTCVACCEEVRELRAAAARMGAGEAIVPPAHLKERVLEAADQADDNAVRLDGKMIDRPVIDRARAILQSSRRAGQ